MLYIENLNGLGLKPTTKFVLYTILKRAFFENKNKIQMTYSYIARQTELSRSTVLREIEFLINSEYIKSERGLFKSQENVNRITHEITLTDKSISILNAEAAKPQNKTIKTEETQPQAEAEKTPQTAPKQVETEQADKVHESETEQTEVIITDVQRGCLIALERAVKRGGTYPEIYVEDALQQGVPQELINNILKKRYSDEI